MDVDFWAARVHSAKNIKPTRLSNHGAVDEEGEDEVRAWFPCPFCYVEIEVPVLCIHLQEEHCFDLKNAVCPICAANLGKDPLSHFTVQHMHSIKQRRKSQKSGFWSNVSPNILKDLRELSSFLGTSSATSSSEPAQDQLLPPFLCKAFKCSQKGKSSCIAATSDTISTNQALSNEVDEQNYEEKNLRATFIQEMVASTILQECFRYPLFQVEACNV
ncbi:protein DEHYDRATION-INDUCED 19 homolog 5-like isoform X3 [Primulina tabacum]|uniref:protein DEHYDRATION-INDUCED 19 homolog 5-like isoform X3 n=1 Tax=Primulina tabacum TaxID=48773 RepID=UPI003F5A1EF3